MMRLKTHIDKQILDACCGSRMFWFDKEHPATVFMDNRSFGKTLCDGRRFEVRPDLIADFREIPFPDESFRLVVFDPPHLYRAGKRSWLGIKYGVLESTWQDDLRRGRAIWLTFMKFPSEEGDID